MKKSKLLLMLFCMLAIQLAAQHKNPEKEKESAKLATKPSTISLEKIINQNNGSFVVTNENVSSVSGTRHIYLRQAINGLEVYGTESSIHFDKTGKVLIEHNNFLADVQATLKNSAQGINDRAAIASVANQMGYKITNLNEIKSIGGKNKAAVFNKAGISLVDIPVKLMYYYREEKGTQLIWELSIAETTSADWWNFRVDASNGKIIDKDNWTVSCNIMEAHNEHFHSGENVAITDFIGPLTETETLINYNEVSKTTVSEAPSALVGGYRVFAIPMESPNHGSMTRTLVNNPDNPTASPFGWHDTNGVAGPESTLTTGNNGDVHKGSDRPNGTASLTFDFTIDLNQNPASNTAPYITNLFYWTNIVHDVMYQYGFDEVSGNFQENNYGNGGAGSDGVNVNAQASGNCNANFSTPNDGSNPTMNMYLCNQSTPSHDSGLDAGVVIHEYGHGISNRLTGGPSNSGCLGNGEQMGEGWSDFYGYIFTMLPTDTGTDARGMGTYLLGEPITGPGIRTQKYSTDFAVNNHTYDDIKTTTAVHYRGEVWATMLWDMTWEIIAIDGFDADVYNGTGGNNVALAIVTEGLRLQPCSPGFVDGRDAILLADQNLYAGAHVCAIWEAFARRGLGYSASQGSSNSNTDGTEAFDLPPSFSSLDVMDEVCLSDGIQTGLSGGNPAGGIYSGAGVTDDGNGTTFTFDPTVGGPGLVTVTYTVNDFCSGVPTALTDDINVTNDPPVIICMGSGNIPMTGSQSSSPGTAIPDNNPTGVTVTMNVTEDVSITDLDVNLNISHSWVGDLIVKIKSPLGTTVTIIDRPGVPASTFGCDGNNIVTTLDDEAGAPVENICAGSVPTINGSFTPNNPLSIFDGESTIGIWELTVSDSASGDTGTINSWGLDYDYEVTAPILDVTLDGSGNATVNAEDLLYGVTVDCGSYTVLAGSPLAATVSFTCSDTGLNTVAVEVTNDNGATSTCSAIVNVIGGGGGGPSTIICPSDISQDNDVGVCEAAITIPQPTVSNGCSGSESALNFDGVDDQVDMPLPVVFDDVANNDITIEMWVNPETAVFSRILFAQKTASNFMSVSYSGQIYFYINNTVGINTSATIPLNTWTHVAARWNATTQTAQIFFDGVLQATVSGGTSSTGTDNKMSLGSRTNSAQFFPGTLDEVRIWDILRSDTEILADFNSCVSESAPGLVAYYKLDDNTGSTVVSDSTLNGYDGTLVNMDAATDWVNGQVQCSSYTMTNDYNNTADASDTYPVGTTTVVWSLLDSIGNTIDTCSMDVTVNDAEAPTAVCQNITVQLDAIGNISIVASDLDGGSSDNCSGSPVLIAGSPYDEFLNYLDPTTYTSVSPAIAITVGGTAVNGINGMDKNPTNGEIYIIVKPSAGGRRLATLDPLTGIATTIGGNLSENFASISFDSTGNLYGVTGDGSTTSESLFSINPTTGAITFLVSLGAGSDGESIAMNPDDGLIYHWSGRDTNFAYQSIDPNTLVVTNIPVTGFATDEVLGAQYIGGGTFLLANLDQEFVTMTTAGVSTMVGSTAPNYYKGMEFSTTGGSSSIAFSASQTDFTCADVGVNNVILTVTDTSGNSSTCTAVVTVEDNVAPTAVCQNFTVQLDASGNASITGTDIDGGSTDNCSIASLSVSPSSFTCADVGPNTVTLTVTDVTGNSSTCTAVVTVEDNVAPTAVCQNITVQLDASGNVSITAGDVDGGSTDACGITSTTIDITDFTCADLGTNNVTLTVTDVNGNSSTCVAVVTVEDDIPPTINCPANITADTDAGLCSAVVNFPLAVGFDNCSVTVSQTGGLSSGSDFPVGINTIEFTATDGSGNTTVCNFTITVTDNELPTMVCQNITIQLDASGNASITAADVDGGSTDNCGIASLSVSPSTFDCSNVGDNPVVLTVIDVNGNSNTCTAIVTVEDITPPVAVCQNITVELDPVTGTVTITGADVDGGSTDACGIGSYSLDIDTFDCSNIGDNTVVLTVTDVNGNDSTCTAIVTVEDNTNPELVCQDFTLELGPDGTAMLDPNDVIASSSDNCGIGTVAVDINEFSCADIGTPVTVQVFISDVNGNLSTCTAIVTVVDLLAPVLTCPTDQTIDPGVGNLFYILPDYFATGEATAIDNCTDPVTITSQSPAAGTALSDGVYTITLTAEDEYGNISTCTFVLTIESVLGVGNNNATIGSLQMYPNPAKNTVTIGNPQSLSLENLSIFDLRGRMVKSIDLRSMGTQKTIDVSEMAAATYLVIIQGENGQITKRLIKE